MNSTIISDSHPLDFLDPFCMKQSSMYMYFTGSV